MEKGEKPVGSGGIKKLYGLSRGDLADLEELDGLDHVGQGKIHRWFPSEVAEAKKRREHRRQQEAEERRQSSGWDNGCKDAFLAGCHSELKEVQRRIEAERRKQTDEWVQRLSDRVAREVVAERKSYEGESDWHRKCRAIM